MKIDKNYYESLVRDSEKLRIIKSLTAKGGHIDKKTLCAILDLDTVSVNFWEGDFPDYDLPWTTLGGGDEK